jgi:hypothetical protein
MRAGLLAAFQQHRMFHGTDGTDVIQDLFTGEICVFYAHVN